MPSGPSCPCEGCTLDRPLKPTILARLDDGPEHAYALADRLSGSRLMNVGRPDRRGARRSLVAMEGQGLVKHIATASDSGEAKRLYRLTPTGKVRLGKCVNTLERCGEGN